MFNKSTLQIVENTFFEGVLLQCCKLQIDAEEVKVQHAHLIYRLKEFAAYKQSTVNFSDCKITTSLPLILSS